jgi:hypothetical protein
MVLAAAAVLALTSGIAQAKPVPEISLEDGAADGVVYVYRHYVNSAFWLPRGVLATLDGRTIANLPFNGCTAMRIPAGHHAVGADWAPSLFFTLDAALSFQRPGKLEPTQGELTAGERRYFRFAISQSSPAYGQVEVQWAFEEVGADEARREMAKCFYVKPKLA